MSLLHLSPELLLKILGYLGPSFFREETRRLAVCKQWFASAYVVFLADVRLSSNSLERFVDTQTGTRQSQLKYNLRYVSLCLQGFTDWKTMMEGDSIDLETLNTWTTKLNHKLTDFVDILRNCKNLETIQVKALGPQFAYYPPDYLYAGVLANLLTVNNITTLELDTWGTHLITRKDGGESTHICLSISALLANLHRLRLRMRSVCPIALRAPPGDSDICLAELIVNLSHYGESLTDTSIAFSRQCGTTHKGLLQLRRDMEEQTSLLVARMSYPKVARILSHSLPHPLVKSWDALTGRRMILSNDADWDDEGSIEKTEGSYEETDLFDNESSTSEE